MSVSLSSLPNEILAEIFKEFQNPADFYSLSETSKQFKVISNMSAIRKFADIPNFIRTSQNPQIQNLSLRQKYEFVQRVEKKFAPSYNLSRFTSSHIFETTVEKALFDERQLPKCIIEDYLIFADYWGKVHFCDLKSITSNQEIVQRAVASMSPQISFTPHEFSKVAKCLVIHGKRPLFITASLSFPGEIKIWDFREIVDLSIKTIKPIFFLSKTDALQNLDAFEKNEHFIQTYKQLLAVSYSNQVKIWDCSKKLSENNALILPFYKPFQITFFNSYLMVVGERQITLWNIDGIRKTIENGSNAPIASVYNLELPNRKIKQVLPHKEKLIIAYDNLLDFVKPGENYSIGEVRSLKTGEQLRILAIPKKDTIHAMDCNGDVLHTGGNEIYSWDLTSEKIAPTSTMSRFGKNTIHTIYALSQCILFASKGELVIKSTANIGNAKAINGFLLRKTDFVSFKIIDDFLLIETEQSTNQDVQSKIISVFNLTKEISPSFWQGTPSKFTF